MIIVIQTPPRTMEYNTFDADGLAKMAGLMRPGGLIVFMQPGETLAALPESEMEKYGWFRRSNPPDGLRSTGGTDHG